jgi:sigma-54 dependent transcriptional regulator, acetoin dehydrogenase operon transcriptional activator AcoR
MSQIVQTATDVPIGPDVQSPGTRPDVVATWHQRARNYGLYEGQAPEFDGVCRPEMFRMLDQHRLLYSHAVSVMETLHEQIQNTHTMIILTDQNGLILHALGDDDFRRQAESVALRPGVSWSERYMGTNAIGTALIDCRATVVHAHEHFLSANHFLTCSCSPIVDPNGNVIGSLDVSGPKESYHAHTMALVRMSTQMIENLLFAHAFQDSIRLHFHARSEFVGTLVEGIAAFSEDGRLLALNRSAQFQLSLSRNDLRGCSMTSVFGISVPALFDKTRPATAGLLTLCMPIGARVYARPEFGGSIVNSHRLQRMAAGGESSLAAAEDCHDSGLRKRLTGALVLRDLDTGDPNIARALEKVGKVLRQEIPVMILGETGTGKELLARAIHNESCRRDKAFVAVDCASIPESLIEAELFGYVEGAFTGARRKGGIGKIMLASGGTLFLDEIGDMPVSLQARLLRVLQERMVTPLGSVKAVPVNLQVICASHHNLRKLIPSGQFREDLYYRLNGLMVRLPALRERSDLEILVSRILAAEAGTQKPLAVSPEVMTVFRRYRWPGNIRQLTNVLRTACVMADDEGVIELHHLQDDFLEDLRCNESRLAGACSTSACGTAAPEPCLPLPESSPADATAGGEPSLTFVGSGTRLDEVQTSVIAAALNRCHGNVSAAARALRVSRNTIYRSLRSAGK